MIRYATPRTRVSEAGSVASRNRNAYGSDNTHCPQRALGQYLIGQQRGGLGHAPRATGRTEATLFAAERDQLFGVAVLATHAQEPFLQSTALQVGVELLLHICRQWSTGRFPNAMTR